MTNQEAIKYLQQLYPNGGHCWLDEQRIEAIDMAVKALREEPVSEDVEQEIEKYFANWLQGASDEGCFNANSELVSIYDCHRIARHFANWQKEQFEKNRLAACDRQTEEEAEREQDFVMGIIENEHRKPTFDDAIKYGMRLHKEQIMANTADAVIGLPYENKDGGYTHLIDVSKPLPVGNNIIAIIFKED